MPPGSAGGPSANRDPETANGTLRRSSPRPIPPVPTRPYAISASWPRSALALAITFSACGGGTRS